MSASQQNQTTTAATTSNNKPSDWAAEAWAWAVENKLNDGTRPRDTTTREEVAAFLWRTSRLLSKK